MSKDFEETCMKKRIKEIEASAVNITNPVEINSLVKSHKNLSAYFLSGAEHVLNSNSPLLAILLGYFAMEQKAYAILALNGFKVTSHVCAIKGLSSIIKRSDLAAVLSKAYENRLEVNYLGNIKTAEIDRKRAANFISGTAKHFIAEVDKLMQVK